MFTGPRPTPHTGAGPRLARPLIRLVNRPHAARSTGSPARTAGRRTPLAQAGIPAGASRHILANASSIWMATPVASSLHPPVGLGRLLASNHWFTKEKCGRNLPRGPRSNEVAEARRAAALPSVEPLFRTTLSDGTEISGNARLAQRPTAIVLKMESVELALSSTRFPSAACLPARGVVEGAEPIARLFADYSRRTGPKRPSGDSKPFGRRDEGHEKGGIGPNSGIDLVRKDRRTRFRTAGRRRRAP